MFGWRGRALDTNLKQTHSSPVNSGSFLELLQPIAELISRNPQHFSRLGLITAAAVNRLAHQRHFYFVERYAARRQLEQLESVAVMRREITLHTARNRPRNVLHGDDFLVFENHRAFDDVAQL